MGMKQAIKAKPEEINYSRIGDSVEMPDLLDLQLLSFKDFLQENVPPDKRTGHGFQKVFEEVFPIYSYDGNTCLEFVSYTLGAPRYDMLECQKKGLTFALPIKVKLRLKKGETVKEEQVFLGNIPMMTPQGSFIINGAERVIVSQLHRSPGICFEPVKRTGKLVLYMMRIIPARGSWMDAEFDRKNNIYFHLEKKRTRRRLLATTLLRALGHGSDAKLIRLFSDLEEMVIARDGEKILGRYLSSSVVDAKNTVLFKAYQQIDDKLFAELKTYKIEKVEVFQPGPAVEPLINMLRADPTDSQESALKFIYKRFRPGDPPTEAKANALIERRFFDRRRFDLGAVGRFKLNRKLGLPTDRDELKNTTLRTKDIVEAVRYLMRLQAGDENTSIDDIDHLGNRRVAMVGELLEEQCRTGMARLERLVKDKMNMYEVSSESLMPHKLVNPKALAGVLRDFFGRSQLSQFMDQTNPLADITHKRRLTALGPGGLPRKRAGFEVRDVHVSHYGRICPIETPEGPNIGLIASLSTYGQVNELGFIETPYRVVENGRITGKIKYLTADDEEAYIIAQANVRVDKDGKMLDEKVQARQKGDFTMAPPAEVHLVDVSPKQLVSVAAGLIPFLEHDDANRALMGSNMQRQAVPLLTSEPALVSTGLEERTALDSRVMVTAEEDGVVERVDAEGIRIGKKTYPLMKYLRSNAGTCVNQRPIVVRGQKVKKGQVIADGSGTAQGQLALGRNVLVSFLPWRGYNFEDAIVISERLLKEDTFTSVHIEKFEVGARDTKLGREEITNDIPNAGEEALRNLDEEGVIRIGAEVKPNDILVGKLTPKSETELLPEERLLRAIFGDKASDVKDTSLRAPSGIEGIVIDAKILSRKERMEDEEEDGKDGGKVSSLNQRHKQAMAKVKEKRRERVEQILHGKKLEGAIVAEDTGSEIIPGSKKITKAMIQKLEARDYEDIQFEGSGEVLAKLRKVIMESAMKLEELALKRSQEMEQIRGGDELEPGVIKKVQVYVATKRRLSVGDKMAGRHGNKGVIAKILPEEDMPFLADGTPVDVVLNPLGVPSRMNVGQVLETTLGWAAKILNLTIVSPVFDGATEADVNDLMKKAGIPPSGKVTLCDGRTGEPFDNDILVGQIYMMKLHHLVADKIHARAIGPYSLVTQQPLGGKAQFGGQRFGEMEVWALEAYGAAYALQEMLTVKSDDIKGRSRIYESIVKGSNLLEAGTPESFNVLIKELRSLALDVRTEKSQAPKETTRL
jgi:DNA-directed RNA polymerase subunit beta